MARILRNPNKKGVGAPRGSATGVSQAAMGGGQVSKDAAGRSGIRRLIARDPAKGVSGNIGSVHDGSKGFRAGAQAALTTAMAGANNDLVFTSKVVGTVGNSTRVRIVVSGNGTALSVSVSGADITVNSATDGGGLATSTASEVKAALDASTPAKALISTALATGNSGAGVVAAFAFTNLTGGADSVLEGVNVVGAPSPRVLKSPLRNSKLSTRIGVLDRAANRVVRKLR